MRGGGNCRQCGLPKATESILFKPESLYFFGVDGQISGREMD